MAAMSCYMLPIMILYGSGQLGTDRFHRDLAGVSIQDRAVKDFLAWLERVGIKQKAETTVVDSMCARAARVLTRPLADAEMFTMALCAHCTAQATKPSGSHRHDDRG